MSDIQEPIMVSEVDDAIIITSVNEYDQRRLRYALSTYNPENKQYSVYLNEGVAPAKSYTADEIDDLATNAQNNLKNIMAINAYNRKLVNKNDIVGKTVEAIQTNINTEVKMIYSKQDEGRNKKKKLAEAEALIEEVNDSVHIKKFIRNLITTTYIEGTVITYLRHENPENYSIDVYPLGVAEISEYEVNGEPVVLINIAELKSKLAKTYKKDKKQKALFFKDIDEEVKNNYPAEVYQAFKNNESYAKLDPAYTGVVRINNLNRRYGLSPIFRAWLDLAMLDTLENTDKINAKAKGKKIIWQKMRKETMGADYKKQWYPELAYAHQNLMSAWQQATVVVTSPPTVEEIKYVEPSVEMTSINTYNYYRSKVLATLGVQFLMDSGSQTVSTANISVEQLLRTINSISEGLEDVLYKWYRQIMIDNGFDYTHAPKPSILDTEQLSKDLKMEYASFFYNTLNTSLETAYETVGLNVQDEAKKRKAEKEQGLDELFAPRMTAYTNSGDSDKEGGRPKESDDESKSLDNETRYEENKKSNS